MELIISHTVGYMLKVLKLGIDTSPFRMQFASIRHGNYFEFCERTNAQIPTMVEYSRGKIEVTNAIRKNDIDFAGLVKSGPAMQKLLHELIEKYGDLTDPDISDIIYHKVAEFEISIRMHASNCKLTDHSNHFIDVIEKLGDFKNLIQEEIEQLQLGRKFLNMIKHPKNQFDSWNEGVFEFEKANDILKKHHLTIIE